MLKVEDALCPGAACLNLHMFTFLSNGTCLCDVGILSAVHADATTARKDLAYALLGALGGLGPAPPHRRGMRLALASVHGQPPRDDVLL